MAEKIDILKQTKNALEAGLKKTAVLVGKEEYLKKSFLSDIKNKLFDSDEALYLDCSILDGGDKYEAVMEALNQPPMLSLRRLVVWYGAFSGSGSDSKTFLSVLKEASLCPDSLLVVYLYDDEFDVKQSSNKTLLTKISELGEVFNFEPMSAERLVKWIKRHFKAEELDISDSLALYLAQRICSNMSELDFEIKKLCAYMKETLTNELSQAIIDKICAPRISFEDFYFTGRIDAFDSDGVIKYINRELERGEDCIVLLAGLSAEIEKLFRIKCAVKDGMRADAIAKAMKMHEYALKLKLNAVKGVSEAHLAQLLTACYEADKAMKSTGADGRVMLHTIASRL